MKRLPVFALAAAVAVAASVGAYAQSASPSVEARHSLSIDLIGADYAFELPIARTATVIGRAGMNFGAAWPGKNGGDWRTGTAIPYGDYTMLAPALELEPRWYYGLDRRDGRGRYTDGNAGSFLSLKVQNTFPGYVTGKFYKFSGTTTFAPTWGLRRVWGGHWTMEFTTGVRFGIRHNGLPWSPDTDIVDHLDFNLRFGYTF